MRSFQACLLVSAMAPLYLACPARTVADVPPQQSVEEQKALPSLNRNLDILFVIDNSGTMTDEQQSLAQNFNAFIDVLRDADGGLPDLHIGVVTTDLGAGNIGGCEGSGDDGLLMTSSEFSGDFILDISDGNDGRITNYSGTLEEAFSSIAVVGDEGCGFEQPMAAMQRALSRNPPGDENSFIRENALLAIILITDEDDCSASNPALLFDESCNTITGCEPGPVHSYRCFEYGVVCDPDRPRDIGPRTTADCRPREDSDRVASVGSFVDFLRGYKNPSLIIPAAIIALPTEFTNVDEIERPNQPNALDVRLSCGSEEQENEPSGRPGIRLEALLSAFPNSAISTSICESDLSGPLSQIAERIRDNVGDPCMPNDLETDPINCAVNEIYLGADGGQIMQPTMPVCSDSNPDALANNSSVKPCYIIAPDTEECDETDHNLKITIIRENDEDPPIGTETQIRCVIARD